jgi:Tol biopolymer transport system component
MAKLNTKKSLSSVLVVVGIAFCRLMFPVAAAQPGQTDTPADAQLDWISAGSKIAFTCDREGQSQPDEICVMNANGTDERRVTPTNDSPNPPCHSLYPHWSPSGRQIAYNCAKINELGRATSDSEIFVTDTDGATVNQLTEGGCPQLDCPGTLGAVWPTWSPDGAQIAFQITKVSPLHIYIINTDGTGLRGPLTGGARPDWSPDGRRIVFQRLGQIFVVDLDDPDLDDPDKAENAGTQLTFVATNQNPRWSPDGRKIVFQRPALGVQQVFVIDADGSNQVQITNFYTDPNSPWHKSPPLTS